MIRGDGKYEINYLKKKSSFPLQGAFSLFFTEICRKRLLGSVSEVRRRSREQKTSDFKKKVLRAFFTHYGSEKQSVCG